MIRPFGFPEFWTIVLAAQWTIALSGIALACGGVGGLLIALVRVSDTKIPRMIATGFIRLFQGTPLLMQLFLVFFGLNIIGFGINPWFAAAIAFTLHASAFLGEIWRGCIEAVPSGQREAATALGLRYYNRMRYVVLPQAAKIAVAPTVGFFVQLIKGTSLAAIIGFTELTRQGQIINNATFSPFLVFTTVAAVYFVLCWPLSLLAGRLERQFSRATAR
jgi:polar amino acid transport system permease protein